MPKNVPRVGANLEGKSTGVKETKWILAGTSS